jgi:hypothetical protein
MKKNNIFNYHPKAEPKLPPPPALAAIGSKLSIPGVAASTSGVGCC